MFTSLALPDFLVPIIIGGLIQVIKVCIDVFINKKITRKALWVSGGFPSTHGGITASITTLMLLKYGFHAPEFALAFAFSFLFWYDAINLRFEAGQHASYINQISKELDSILELRGKGGVLKERLGHTFFEVVGGIIIGATLTVLYYLLFAM